MTVLAVFPGKKPVKIALEGSLESMQAFVGGAIQAIYPFDDPVAIVCNEEGKLMGLEYNRAFVMKRVRSMTSCAAHFSYAVWERMILRLCLTT